MSNITDAAERAFRAIGDMSHKERVSTCAHLLKCSMLLAIDNDSDECQEAFDEEMQEFLKDFSEEWVNNPY